MTTLHERADELNRVEARIQELARELLAVTVSDPWQHVHVRKRELDALEARRARLLACLS